MKSTKCYLSFVNGHFLVEHTYNISRLKKVVSNLASLLFFKQVFPLNTHCVHDFKLHRNIVWFFGEIILNHNVTENIKYKI